MELGEKKYQTGMKRVVAAIIDAILLAIPFTAVSLNVSIPPTHQILFDSLKTLIPVAYSIGMHYQYGQTLGKMAMDIKVVDVTESRTITIRQAFLRDSVWLGIEAINLLLVVILSVWIGLQPNGFLLVFQSILGSFATIWVILEIISMFTNEKRRAIHDFLAGTVVVSN